MRLFHFCADHMLPSILREGLTLGSVCWLEGKSIRKLDGLQWLTEIGDRDRQEWCNPEFSNLPYDRAANRISVVIPKTSISHLHRWVDVGPLIVPPESFQALNEYGQPESYWLFRGRIPPGWFRQVKELGARWGLADLPERCWDDAEAKNCEEAP